MVPLCKLNYDASVIQAKEYNSNVYLNPSIFQAVMKMHLNELELFVIQAFGNNRLRVNSSRSVGECGGEIKARRHCLSLDPDAALLCWGIAHLQCRNQPHPLSSSPPPHKWRENPTFSLHLKIALWLFSCPASPPLPCPVLFETLSFHKHLLAKGNP